MNKKLLVLLMALALCCQSCFALAAGFTAGTYAATVDGHNAPMTVEVVFTADAIESIAITAHGETPGISDPALTRVPQMIVDAQSVQVDTIASATVSSKAIIAAVSDCIVQAGGDPAAMAPKAAKTYEKALTAGAYTATAHGHHSDVIVETVVTADAIESVTVTAHAETLHIGDAAVEKMPAAIVAHQSVAVDAVTGATYTSRAILNAVEDCLRQAGGDDAIMAFSTPVEKPERSTEEKTETVDVVVVGSGLTGTVAALAAQEAGAKVVILEKLPYYGGISQTSAAAAKIDALDDENGEGEYYQYLLYKPVGLMQDRDAMVNGYPDLEAAQVLADLSRPTAEWMAEMGVTVNYIEGMRDELGLFNMSLAKLSDGVHLNTSDECGGAIEVMMNRFLENGGKLYLETPATELITDETGAVVGVKAEGMDGNYTFNCKGVALCCGGFGNNPEMIAELAPAFAGETMGGTCIGNTGDGIRMAREIGAAVYKDNFLMGGAGRAFITDYDLLTPYADCESPKAALHVNPMGMRVNSEDPVSYTSAITYANPHTEDYYWIITNEEVANTNYYVSPYYPSEDTIRGNYIDLLTEALAEGKPGIYKADTLEDLARMINITPTTLMYTVSHYNNLCEQGEDTDLHKNPQYLIAMTEGPWYAAKADMEYFGTVGGIVTDATSAVLREDGTAIPGLYAAGETSNHKVLNMSYSGGVSVSENIVFGKLSGEGAAAAAGFAK